MPRLKTYVVAVTRTYVVEAESMIEAVGYAINDEAQVIAVVTSCKEPDEATEKRN